MGTLFEMADEYKRNIEPMLQRIAALESQLKKEKSTEKRRKLNHRINQLQIIVAQNRKTIFDLEHYYGET